MGDERGGGVGIGPAIHVFGPASVHILPCRIHHTGPAPVATYFRPQGPFARDKSLPQDENVAPAVEKDGQKSETNESSKGGERSDADISPAEKEEGVAVVLGKRKKGQVWRHFDDDPDEYTARFRGRKLMGRKIALPKGVHGVVLKEKPWPQDARRGNEELATFWAAETCFTEISVWGHDEVRRRSPVDRCLAWLEVSKSIHDP